MKLAMVVLVMVAGPAPAAAGAEMPAARAWGEELFARAAHEGRPILLVVGDALCVPCAADEEGALGDRETAALLARTCLLARVDRFDRPDLDDLFSTAVVALGGQRRYPLAVFLTPDGGPFAGRGGFSAQDEGDQPSLRRIVLRAWSEFEHDRAAVAARAAGTTEALQRAQRSEPPLRAASAELAQAALHGLLESHDPVSGGFGVGRAYAPAATLRLLLSELERAERPEVRRLLKGTLDGLMSGPDPAALAERALLLEALARAHALAGSTAYRERALRLAASARDFADAQGAFRASASSTASRTDDRLIAGWNGLMIGALALSGEIFDRPDDVELARRAAGAVLARLGPASRLMRSPGRPALLEDHAYLAEGLLRLDQALEGKEPRWLDEAAALVESATGRFFDMQAGGFFDAIAGAEWYVPPRLPARLKSGYDGSLPAANAVMAAVLLRLSHQTAQPRHGELARRTVEAFLGDMQRTPRGMEGLAAVASELYAPLEPAASAAGSSRLPSRATEGAVSFESSAAPDLSRAGEPLTARVRLTIEPGWSLIAPQGGGHGLRGLAVSVGGEGLVLAEPRYPPARTLEGAWGSGPVKVYEGDLVIEVPVRLTAGGAWPSHVRLRVAYQACREQATRCEPPQSVALDAPLAPWPVR